MPLYRSYLREDLNVEQLDVQLRAGKLKLTDLTVDVDAVNEHLAGLPVKLVSGSIKSIEATLSYGSLLAEGCTVDLEGLHLTLAPVSPEDAIAAAAAARAAKGRDDDDDIGEDPRVADRLREAAFGRDRATREGLQTLAAWIQEVTSRIRLTVRDLKISVTPSEECASRLTLHCPLAEFFDETPNVGAGSVSGSRMEGSMRGRQSFEGRTSFQVSSMHKVLALHGFCVAVHTRGSGERPDSVCTLLESAYRATPSRVKIVIGTGVRASDPIDVDFFVKVSCCV